MKDCSRSRKKSKDLEAKPSAETNDASISIYLLNNLDKLQLSNDGKIASKVLLDRLKMMLPFIEKPISSLLQEVYRQLLVILLLELQQQEH